MQPGQVFAEHQIYALATVPGAGWFTRHAGVRSSDAGVTWVRATAGADIVNAQLMIDPMDPRSVIAGARRRIQSTDDGATWRPIFQGMVEDTKSSASR